LQRALESARRDGARHTLCFVDLDQFKLVNDTCGHDVGDQLLRQVAHTLQSQLRAVDWLGRLGGDEFAILLERTPVEAGERVAARVNEALGASTFAWEGHTFNIPCCIGVVEIDSKTPDIRWLLRAADTACYLAKESGRNRIRVYHEADGAVARRIGEMGWVSEIRSAIAEDRLLLFAQRIDAARGGGELNYEILVRLIDAKGKIHAPGAFLPAAERYDQATAIDRHVFALVLRQLEANPRHLLQLGLCHINVSAQSIANAEFRSYVASMLERSRVPARKLCFEITETAAIGNIAEARLFIDQMRARGCRIALDDFGSGMSSFAYLKNLVVDILKVDGVFVSEAATDPVNWALVKSICVVGRALGKTTIAEWVESSSVQARLREIGVDYVQGYAIHKPCPLEELMAEGETIRLVNAVG
jgi:diguanylate cyclase (GGDEF)-like protein